MGTGGTLPTNITQRVTLYNTTGVIEKDKGIYFCPFIRTNFPVPVFQRWLTAFHNIVDTNDNYKNIPISQWSPQDRTLTIKGNIDDFRLITEEGESFNYLIVIRSVRTNNVTLTHFYAFFITDVQQVGNGSVRLELEPDDFTNVFYLHNRKPCNSYEGYYVDVFNEHMKNCYVARQHYNRVKESPRPLSYEDNDVGYEGNPTVIDINLYSEITELSNYRGKLDITNISLHDVSHHFDITDDITKQELTLTENGYVLHLELAYYFQDEQLSINLQLQSYYAEEDNLPIFSQIEEGFKYKRQFRDYSEYVNDGNPLTEEEKAVIEEEDTFNNLSEALREKIYKICLNYAHVVLSDNKVLLNNSTSSTSTKPSTDVKSNVSYRSPLTVLTVPFIEIPEYLKKYNNSINKDVPIYIKQQDNNEYRLYYKDDITSGFSPHIAVNLSTLSSISDVVNNYEDINNYIVSIFVSKEVIWKTVEISVSSSGYKCVCGVFNNNLAFLPRTLVVGQSQGQPPVYTETVVQYPINDVINNIVSYKYNLTALNTQEVIAEGTQYQYLAGIPVIVTSVGTKEYEMELKPKKLPELDTIKDVYFDTVLNFEPYSFYSVSYLGNIETVLSRKNYYETDLVKFITTIDYSDSIKFSVIPYTKINGNYQKLYNESLMNTSASSLLFKTTALSQYMIANRTQMKNQYAVNDLEHATGMLTSFVSGIGNTAGSGVKTAMLGMGAGVGVVGGAIQTATSLLNEGINWSKDTKEIEMNQKAKLGDLGNMPSNIKQYGTNAYIDFATGQTGLYLNHYTIDELSYNSICKYLERFGYVVNIYDSLNVNTRKGWDFVQLKSFDYEAQITVEQEEKIRQIFANGVTLLHDKSFMVSGHNYEIILD